MKKLLTALVLLSSLVSPAFAEAPSCTAANVGVTECMAHRVCECKYFRASQMKGTPSGYRWDCGITRPACIDPNSSVKTTPYDGPQAVGIDNSTTNIEQK